MKNLQNYRHIENFKFYDLSTEIVYLNNGDTQILLPLFYFYDNNQNQLDKIAYSESFRDSYKVHPSIFKQCNLDDNCNSEFDQDSQEYWTLGVFIA